MVSVVGASKSLHTMSHKNDAAETIRKEVGDISGLEITGVQVLVGTYLRPDTTAGGIILTEKFRDEDLYQGKVGLVLAVAPGAFIDGGADTKFNGFQAKVGDWIFYRVQDGFSMSINGRHCRMLEDAHVRGRLPHPDMVL